MTQPGIPNEYSLSTACYGTRLRTIEDQVFAAVAMGFRRLELGLTEAPVPLNGFEDTQRETGLEVRSLVCGCLDPRTERVSGTRLGSLDEDSRERALISLRRHVQLAKRYGCPVVVLRGCPIENPALRQEALDLDARLVRGGASEEFVVEAQEFVSRLHKKAQRQLEHLCRSLHTVMNEHPEVRVAIEPGPHFNDVLNFEAMGWVLEDLTKAGLGYWHDVGTIHLRERAGLAGQGDWLDSYAPRMLGVHVHDATATEAFLPPGCGEVDFKLLCEYLPRTAERVIELDPRHGRTEILGAVRFLADKGF